MTQAFFLTRQTANLMEDFVRELTAGANLYLLYGDSGVGKTRMLEELVRTRLGERKVHWIDLKAGGAGDGALVDSSQMIENVFASARAGDIIIADHFEMALKKTRHQLFLSWSTDGFDRHLNLIIAGNTDYFNGIEQLAQQYQVRLQSLQQMPLNPDEAAAFLGAYLFPDRLIGKLSVPPLLRKQLSEVQGNIGGIIDVAERAGDQITSNPMDDTESERKGSRIIVGVLVAVTLVAVAGWYFLNSKVQQDLQITEQVDIAQPATSMPAQDNAAEISRAAEIKPFSESQDEVEMIAESTAIEPATPAVIASLALEPAAPETELAANPGPEMSTDLADVAPIEQTAALPEAESVTEPVAEPEPETQPQQGRLQRDLQASMEWIDRTDRTVGTLQMMMLNEKRFDEPAYYEYIDQLAAAGVDPSAIRILRTLTAGQEVYSVVYGEYESWKVAGDAKDDLPAILKKNSPIPRSVGGLLDEIRRLEGQN